MTPEQIAQAYRSGELNSQTPIWPPGYGGWQALGSIQQLRSLAAEPQQASLSQYDESEDDPTRMWMGPEDYEVAELDAQQMQPGGMPSRPASITGPRLVQGPPLPNIPYSGPSAYQRQTGRSGPGPATGSGYSAPAPANVSPARFGAAASAASRPLSEPPFRAPGRQRWVMIGIGLVGLAFLASAVVLARSGSTAEASKPAPVAAKPAEASPVREPAAAEAVVPAAQKMAEPEPAATQAAAKDEAAKDDDKAAEAKPSEAASAFVANDEAKEDKDEQEAAPTKKRSRWSRSGASKAKSKWSSRAAAKRQAAAEAEAEAAEAPKEKEKEKADRATAMLPTAGAVKKEGEPQDEAKSDRDAAAAKALTNAASMAASCRPPGGPTGTGKVRVGYNNDGSVGSVEIMTASFAGTTTASCVSMVFRRAKIPAFKGDPPTFIKSFTIPE